MSEAAQENAAILAARAAEAAAENQRMRETEATARMAQNAVLQQEAAKVAIVVTPETQEAAQVQAVIAAYQQMAASRLPTIEEERAVPLPSIPVAPVVGGVVTEDAARLAQSAAIQEAMRATAQVAAVKAGYVQVAELKTGERVLSEGKVGTEYEGQAAVTYTNYQLSQIDKNISLAQGMIKTITDSYTASQAQRQSYLANKGTYTKDSWATYESNYNKYNQQVQDALAELNSYMARAQDSKSKGQKGVKDIQKWLQGLKKAQAEYGKMKKAAGRAAVEAEGARVRAFGVVASTKMGQEPWWTATYKDNGIEKTVKFRTVEEAEQFLAGRQKTLMDQQRARAGIDRMAAQLDTQATQLAELIHGDIYNKEDAEDYINQLRPLVTSSTTPTPDPLGDLWSATREKLGELEKGAQWEKGRGAYHMVPPSRVSPEVMQARLVHLALSATVGAATTLPYVVLGTVGGPVVGGLVLAAMMAGLLNPANREAMADFVKKHPEEFVAGLLGSLAAGVGVSAIKKAYTSYKNEIPNALQKQIDMQLKTDVPDLPSIDEGLLAEAANEVSNPGKLWEKATSRGELPSWDSALAERIFKSMSPEEIIQLFNEEKKYFGDLSAVDTNVLLKKVLTDLRSSLGAEKFKLLEETAPWTSEEQIAARFLKGLSPEDVKTYLDGSDYQVLMLARDGSYTPQTVGSLILNYPELADLGVTPIYQPYGANVPASIRPYIVSIPGTPGMSVSPLLIAALAKVAQQGYISEEDIESLIRQNKIELSTYKDFLSEVQVPWTYEDLVGLTLPDIAQLTVPVVVPINAPVVEFVKEPITEPITEPVTEPVTGTTVELLHVQEPVLEVPELVIPLLKRVPLGRRVPMQPEKEKEYPRGKGTEARLDMKIKAPESPYPEQYKVHVYYLANGEILHPRAYSHKHAVSEAIRMRKVKLKPVQIDVEKVE